MSNLKIQEQVERIKSIMKHTNVCSDCDFSYTPMISGCGIEDLCPKCDHEKLSEIKEHLEEVAPQIFESIHSQMTNLNSRGRTSEKLLSEIKRKTIVQIDTSIIEEIISRQNVSDEDDYITQCAA